MKFCKLLLATVGAAVIFAVSASSATAGRLSNSSSTFVATWSRMVATGNIGNVDCEVTLGGSLHAGTLTKTASLLIGYVTGGHVTRCARGGATVLREILPFHVQYSGFAGTLPNISSTRINVIDFGLDLTEPTFGITCLVRSTTSEPITLSLNLAAGIVQSMTVGGTIRCGLWGGIRATLSGTSSRPTNGGGAAITVTLI